MAPRSGRRPGSRDRPQDQTVTAVDHHIDEDRVRSSTPRHLEEAERAGSPPQVAEIPFVAFTGRAKADHVTCRLIVRRQAPPPLASDGTERANCSRLPPPRLHHQLHPPMAGDQRTVTTRSSSKSSQNSKTTPWPTCHREYSANAAWVSSRSCIHHRSCRRGRRQHDQGQMGHLRKKIITSRPARFHRTSLELHYRSTARPTAGNPPRRANRATATATTTTPQQARRDHQGRAGKTALPPAYPPRTPSDATDQSTNQRRWIRVSKGDDASGGLEQD